MQAAEAPSEGAEALLIVASCSEAAIFAKTSALSALELSALGQTETSGTLLEAAQLFKHSCIHGPWKRHERPAVSKSENT